MKLRAVLVIATLAAGACSLGGMQVSLGDGPLQANLGGGGDGNTGAAGLDTGVGGLNVDTGPMDVTCPDGTKTTISGTVWDPAGQVPLYNAVVYVPKTPGQLDPLPSTVRCEKCTDPVPARAATLSGPDGKFLLEDVPAGNVDLVVQVGKWRRKQTIQVTQCQDNPLTDRNQTRLPKSHGEGDIPKIAVSTGHSDALECLLKKIGIADTEFSTDANKLARVNLFVGCEENNAEPDGTKHTGASHFREDLGGGSFPSTNQLFDAGNLDQYDVLVFSCEGHKCDSIQTPAHIAQLVDFANRGGRVFLDHDHYNWLNNSNLPIEAAAQFSSSQDDVPSPLATKINTSFPKGAAFAEWLFNLDASTPKGTLDIYTARTSVQSLTDNRAQSWIYRKENDKYDGFFYFTIGTPVAVKDDDPPPEACGRVVFTDLHLSKAGGGEPTQNDISDQNTPFPDGCTTTTLSQQEKALEFMFFDLTSCVQQETTIPTPPVVK
jgi:hypothetical protein